MSLIGRISVYFDAKGYGFIRPTDGSKDQFFHISEFPAAEMAIVGALVEFDVTERDGRTRATNILVIESGE